jgi:hypothetical protein
VVANISPGGGLSRALALGNIKKNPFALKRAAKRSTKLSCSGAHTFTSIHEKIQLQSFPMRGPLLGVALAAMVLFAHGENPLPIEKADVLPLALSDDFSFRKFKIFTNAMPNPTATPIPTKDLMIDFERRRRQWGAINYVDGLAKTGSYFTFFWRANRPANLTLRFEYRQTNLRDYVQARELYYPNAKGSYVSEIGVLGDDYATDGPITSWRALLIENRTIVGLLQSRTWR